MNRDTKRDTTVLGMTLLAAATCAFVLEGSGRAQIPSDVKPVPSGPAVPLAEMQAKCDPSLVERTAALRTDAAYNPRVGGAAEVLAKVRPIFEGFAPNGFETRTGGTVFTTEYGMLANMRPWNFHVLGYPYSCLSNGKLYKNSHYAFSAYLTINDGLDRGAYRLPTDYNPDSTNGDGTGEESKFGFYKLRDEWLVDGLPQAKNGYFHFRGEDEDTYWFTRDGQLPFAYVSREEFLRKQIRILQAGLPHDRRGMTSTYTAAGLPVDQAALDRILGPIYEKPLARYEQMLQQPAAWLQQQAIVRLNGTIDEVSYEFLDASQLGFGVQVPVKPNPGYLDPSRPSGTPQYLVLTLKNQHKRGEYYQLRERVEQNVDVFKSLVN